MKKLIFGLVLMSLLSGTVFALEDTGTKVVDNFNSIANNCNTNAIESYYCSTLRSSIPLLGRTEGVGCAGSAAVPTANCITIVNVNGGDKAVRLHIENDPGSGFSFTQLSGVRDAMPSGPMRWLPAAGTKIIFKVKARFSPNYQAATANGSVGFGLWNMPTFLLSGPPFISVGPAKAVWFTWTDADYMGGTYTGIHGSYFNKSTPNTVQDGAVAFTGVDLTQWATYKLVWKADRSGNQTIKYVVEQHGNKTVQTLAVNPPITQALSVVLWNDCSVLTTPTTGGCQQPNPGSPQNVDITRMVIKHVGMDADEDSD